MSKYDFEIDLSQNSSTGMILSRIPKGAAVLEFGCATGRMTRYMKEALGCRVYIVEYERSAFESAMQYAEDGLCDDILNFRWAEKFREIRFDAIVFADVLEHLSAPEKVLERAGKLLKENGHLYASIPNITHSDILLKACEERFDYTETGLLDDTHIHFWGLENIKALAGKCGMSIKRIEGTRCAIGDSEQSVQHTGGEHTLLENILRERQCGEVYQFVVTFCREAVQEAEYVFQVPFIRSHVYLDTGRDFNPEEIIAFTSVYSGDGSYTARCLVKNDGSLRRIRMDPIEGQSCILCKISVRQGGEELTVFAPDGRKLEDGILLPGGDPKVYIDVRPNGYPVVISAQIILPGEKYIRLLESACGSSYAALERGNADHEQLRRDLGAYITLANNKDKYALSLEGERANLESQLRARDSRISELESTVAYYQNLKIMRLRRFIGRVLRGIKRRLKRLMGKGEHA